jgi:hypothetical protein
MKKIADKWYIGLIIIPTTINLLTELLDFPTLLKSWNLTIIGTLLIANLIFIYELHSLQREYKKLKVVPKESDKKVIYKLLAILNVDDFQHKICEQHCWYGYEKDAFYKMLEFCERCKSLKFKTADNKLNTLIHSLRSSIEDFEEMASKLLFSDGDNYLSPDKNTDFNVERNKELCPIADEKSSICLQKLSELLDYLKTNNYFE